MHNGSFRRVVLGLLAGLSVGATCRTMAGEASTVSGGNLAMVAQPSSSYVSGDTRNSALHHGYDPRSSRDNRQGSYGNWPTRGTQWVQYDWSQPIFTDRIEVYWWDDQRGVRLPRACRLLYWDGQSFVPVPNASGLGVQGDRYNTTTFDEVQTSRLRLEIDGDGAFSTGILQWKVYDSGRSPDFPPLVTAGVDRVVMVGGRTYLNGTVRTLQPDGATPATWSKRSGPGPVTFEDPGHLTTTATFSVEGRYVLELTAGTPPRTAAATLTVQAVPRPPATHLRPVDTTAYRIDSPLWNHRSKALIVHWIPHCIRKISDPDLREGGINNFLDAANRLAGKPAGGHRGYVFSNAWVYNTIESICVALMVDPGSDQEILQAQQFMKATLEDWIPKILAAQEPDGYLQTAFTLSNRERWSPRHRADHEGYVAGYFLEAAIAHHGLTRGQDRRLYDAAKKLADCWDDHLGPPPKKAWYDEHQGMEIALVRFGRYVNQIEGEGRGDRYIRLAQFLLDNRGGGHEYDQSHLPVQQQYEAVGHAVRASYSYAGMADVAMETHDIDYQSAVMSLWDNIVHRKYYVTGGIGSGETSEGFGPDYSLRHNAYCESCSSCGLIFFQHKLNMAYHDARFADLLEETLYNALLGSIDLEGKNFYYQNPLDSRGPRYDWHGCPCCVGNIPRVLLMLPTWMYVRDDQGIYVNLFIGSTVKIDGVAGTDVELVQITDHPRGGDVAIVVNPAEETPFRIHVRAPNRGVSDLYNAQPASDGIRSILVNGSVIEPDVVNGYAVIHRTWKAGDKIELTLPMQIQRIQGSEKIAATAGQVALRYGPLVYCVEAADQPLDKTLAPHAPLTARWRGDLLGGVTVLTGAWSDGTALTAIPYYARDNRIGMLSQPDDGEEASRRRRTSRGIHSTVWVRQQ
jgi:uncharacterized protein